MINKKKRAYLRVSEYKKSTPLLDKVKNKFIVSLREGEYPISFNIFILLSLLCAGVIFSVYKGITGSTMFALISSVLALTIPYLILKTPLTMNKIVEDAIAYKDFIMAIQSSLRSSNSTREAIIVAANEQINNREIKKIMSEAVADIKMGDSIEEVLTKAADKTTNKFFKMTLTIIKINHNVGTSAAITALDNIQNEMDHILSNIQLLKDKINAAIMTKTLFLLIDLAIPIMHGTAMKEMIGDFYINTTTQIIMCVIMLAIYIGQFVIDIVTERALRNL